MYHGDDKARTMIEREKQKEIHDTVFEKALSFGKPQQQKLTNMFKSTDKNTIVKSRRRTNQ